MSKLEIEKEEIVKIEYIKINDTAQVFDKFIGKIPSNISELTYGWRSYRLYDLKDIENLDNTVMIGEIINNEYIDYKDNLSKLSNEDEFSFNFVSKSYIFRKIVSHLLNNNHYGFMISNENQLLAVQKVLYDKATEDLILKTLFRKEQRDFENEILYSDKEVDNFLNDVFNKIDDKIKEELECLK